MAAFLGLTLAVLAISSSTAQAGTLAGRSVLVDRAIQDLARQADHIHQSISRQALLANRRLAPLAGEAPQRGRHLQAASPCAWVAGACDISNEYFDQQALLMPEGPLRDVASQDRICLALADRVACGQNANCQWMDTAMKCYASDKKGMKAIDPTPILRQAFQSSACSSAGANYLQALFSCAFDAAHCPSTCDVTAGYDLVNGACRASSQCTSKATTNPLGDMAALCPAGFDLNQNVADCMHNNPLQASNSTAMTLCSSQACPLLQKVLIAEAAQSAVCGQIKLSSTCGSTARCAWKGSTNWCDGDVDYFGIILADIPTTCTGPQAAFGALNQCNSVSKQATCPSDNCTWAPAQWCTSSGTLQTDPGCQTTTATRLRAIGWATGAPAVPFDNMLKAARSCAAALNEGACKAVPNTWDTTTTTPMPDTTPSVTTTTTTTAIMRIGAASDAAVLEASSLTGLYLPAFVALAAVWGHRW